MFEKILTITFCGMIVCLFLLIFFGELSEYNKRYEKELIIKYSEHYNIYDNCTEIDNKYYCEVAEYEN